MSQTQTKRVRESVYSSEGLTGSRKLLDIGLSYYYDPQRLSFSKEILCTPFLLTSFYLVSLESSSLL